MQTMEFKTSMKCGGCIATATPFLEKVQGIEKWEVDTAAPDKTLTVQGEAFKAEDVIRAVTDAGFKIEPKQ